MQKVRIKYHYPQEQFTKELTLDLTPEEAQEQADLEMHVASYHIPPDAILDSVEVV